MTIVRMPSAEFARICKDLSSLVIISVTKEGVKFTTRGDIGTANIVCRQNTSVDKPEEATVIVMKEAEIDYIRFYLAPKIEEDEETEPQVETRPQKEVKPKAETKPKAGTKPIVETKPKVEIKPEEESETHELSMVPVDITPKDEAEIMDVED